MYWKNPHLTNEQGKTLTLKIHRKGKTGLGDILTVSKCQLERTATDRGGGGIYKKGRIRGRIYIMGDPPQR